MSPYQSKIKIFLTLIILLFTNTAVVAQDDSLALPYPSMQFGLPDNFDETIEYSLDNGEFIFQKNIGSIATAKAELNNSKSRIILLFAIKTIPIINPIQPILTAPKPKLSNLSIVSPPAENE